MAFIDVFANDPSDIRSLQVNFKGLDGYSHMYLTGAVELSFDLLGYRKGWRFPPNDDLANSRKSMLDALSSLIVSLSAEYEVLYNYDYVLNERCSLEFDSLETLLYTTTVLQLAPQPCWFFLDRAVENGIIDSQYIKKIYFDRGMSFSLTKFEKFRDRLKHFQKEQFRKSHSFSCNCKRCTEGIDDSQNEMTYYSEDLNFVKGMTKRELDKILYGLNGTYKVILEDSSIQSHKFYEELHYNSLVNARILQAKDLRTLAMPPVSGEKSLVSALRTKLGGLSSGRHKFVSGFLMGGFAFAAFANAKRRAHA